MSWMLLLRLRDTCPGDIITQEDGRLGHLCYASEMPVAGSWSTPTFRVMPGDMVLIMAKVEDDKVLVCCATSQGTGCVGWIINRTSEFGWKPVNVTRAMLLSRQRKQGALGDFSEVV